MSARGPLVAVLERARALGFLGPGPVEPHLRHAVAFAAALEGLEGPVIDLGSGAGVPGLVVACERPGLTVVLLDAMARRCRFLEEAVAELGLGARVSVSCARAEEAGRGPLRGTASAVLARSFGPPAVTAECAAPLLVVGGRLLVSEPPDERGRWPAAGLALLGMEVGPRLAHPAIQVLVQASACPDRYPRRAGIPSKRPLF